MCLTDDLRVDPARAGDGVDVESRQDEGVVPVEGVRVLLGVLLPLPRAEVGEEVVYVVRSVEAVRVAVQDLQTLEDELDSVAQ